MGRILVIEFKERDSSAFDEVMEVLKRYPDFEHLRLNNESVLSLPGLEICPERRKAYRNYREIELNRTGKAHFSVTSFGWKRVWGAGSRVWQTICFVYRLISKVEKIIVLWSHLLLECLIIFPRLAYRFPITSGQCFF